jgi:DNA polymerase-3 subunit epsilon
VALQIRRPALPKAIDAVVLNELPDGPGVYTFEDEAGRPLYIGKSINIRKRVLQHFGRDHEDSHEFKIAQHVRHVSAQQTNGELAALLLESRLIKEQQPLYNRKLRRMSKLMLARQEYDQNGYLRINLDEANEIDVHETNDILAVYSHRGKARDSLNEIVKAYELCPKLMGLEKSTGACFWRQLRKCRGACVGEEDAQRYNERLLLAFERRRIQDWPYEGPILLQEKYTEQLAGIIVDKWCVLAEVTQEQYCEPVVKNHTQVFDLDTYKILQAYLTSKFQKLSIRPLNPLELREIGV